MAIRTFYNELINCGVSDTLDEDVNKRIRLLNTYALVWGNLIFLILHIGLIRDLVVLFFGKNNFKFYNTYALTLQYFTVFLLFSTIYLNKIRYFKTAKLVFLTTGLMNFTVFSLVIRPEYYGEYFLLIIPPLALSLYRKIYIPIIIFLISFFLFTLPYTYYNLYGFDNGAYLVEQQFNLFIAIFLLVNYFKRINQKNEELLKLEKEKALKDKILLEKQQKELKELNDFKSHFFVNLSHEIRTPLTLIQGHADGINLNDNKEVTLDKIDIIKSQSDQIHSLINNIMDLGKIDEKVLKLNSKQEDVSTFLTKHYTNFKSLFDAKSIQFTFENNVQNASFSIDGYLFSKSINNLLNNALKFTPKGGTVVLKTDFKQHYLTITVTDNGIGIPEEDLDKIFNRFYQSENHITKSQGSGIGLFFTKNIIEAHNFSITVESIPNVSTTFCVKIKDDFLQYNNTHLVSSKIEKTNELIKVKKAAYYEHSKKSTRKILIVEDHEQMRNYIASILEEYHITEAENGEEALRILKDNTFDVIITDYMMPVMDGKALVENIKQQQIKSPIIVLTARTDKAGKLNMLRLGIDGYLNKPFVREELLLHLKQAFQSYDTIKSFDEQLDEKDKENLNKFAQKFNDNLNLFVSQNMHTPNFGVDTIAEHFNMSKSTLNRKLKSLLGQVPKDIIMEARLQKARTLLEENPTETQKNIANAVGIKNTSYFFKRIEERFGRLS